MNEILSKISSYNIFNYLFPGAVFVVLAERLQLLTLPQMDIVTRLLIYYSAGLTISRIGSVLLEPFAKKTGLVRYSDYGDFVRACVKDPKLEVLVEQSNTYRTITAGVLCILLTWAAHQYSPTVGLSPAQATAACLVLFFLLFLISFRKQSTFVRKRVEAHTAASVLPAPAPPPSA